MAYCLKWQKTAQKELFFVSLEAPPRFELGVKALQASALPLGHGAVLGIWWGFFDDIFWLAKNRNDLF